MSVGAGAVYEGALAGTAGLRFCPPGFQGFGDEAPDALIETVKTRAWDRLLNVRTDTAAGYDADVGGGRQQKGRWTVDPWR